MQKLEFNLFEKAGKENTQACLQNAKSNADILGIKKIIIASTFGDTIQEAVKVFDPSKYELICVTHSAGWAENVNKEFPDKIKLELQNKGVHFVTGTLAFSGVDSALLRKFQYFDFIALYARLLRLNVCDGFKVTIEITMMATDAGEVNSGEDIIAIAGTGRGADTCCLIKAASTRLFENLRIKAILAKPI